MKSYDFYNPTLLNFLDDYPQIDLESLIVDLLPFIYHLVENKKENIDDIKVTFKELFNDLKNENKKLIKQQNDMKEQYKHEMNNCIKLLDERQSNIKMLVEKNIKDNSTNLFQMLKEKDSEQFSQNLTKVESMILKTNEKLIDKLNEEGTKIHGLLHNEISPLQNSVRDFTNQFQNSSKKGKQSENKLQNTLINMFPQMEIEDTSKTLASGDFIMHHHTLGKIMVENKCYSQNVRREEVEKFLRDVQQQKCHGILISQHTGIVNKPNFHIESFDGFVNIYIHNLNYDQDTLYNAFSVMESVSNLHNTYDTSLKCSKQDLQNIMKEYTNFNSSQQNVINSLQDNIKTLKDNTIPSLKFILESNIPSSFQNNSKGFTCDICNKIFEKKSSLSQHKRFCKSVNEH